MTPFRKNAFQMKGERGSSLDLARGRLVVINAFFVIVFFVVAARLVDLSLIQAATYKKEEALTETSVAEKKKARADIFDRNGILLARSIETSSLFADPSLVVDAESLAQNLVRIFPDKKYGDLLQKLQGKGRYVSLQKNLTPEQQAQLLYLGDPALGFEKTDMRLYPQGRLASHIVGAVSSDVQGLAGIEHSFNGYLHDGDTPLTLTIDVRLQHAVRREIENTVTKFHAKAGTGIIMDARNGEILAAVSYPDFDPYNFADEPEKNKFNRFSLATYELGSVFKIFSVAAFLDKQKNPMTRSFDVTEPLKVRGRPPIKDYHPLKHRITVPEVFVHSSNIGTSLMAQEMGTEKLLGQYDALGLLEKTSLELSELGMPFKNNPWQEVDTLPASFGHSIATTPLNLVTATATVIGEGTKVEPTLILNHSGQSNATKGDGERIISPQTVHRMRQLMRLNVTDENGSGKASNVPGYLVGGKTGTAEKIGGGTYARKKLLSSYVGAFPMHAPRYVVYVMIDEPQGIKETYNFATGGWVAAPAVGNIIEAMAVILNIPPVQDDHFEQPLQAYVKSKESLKKQASATTQ